MSDDQPSNPTYSTLHFLVSHGDMVAIVFALAPVLGGLVVWIAGMSFIFAIAGVVAGLFLYLIMRSYVELVRVIVDMLLPK